MLKHARVRISPPHVQEVIIATSNLTCLDATANIVQRFKRWQFLREESCLYAPGKVDLHGSLAFHFHPLSHLFREIDVLQSNACLARHGI